jgi:hypothetical protein
MKSNMVYNIFITRNFDSVIQLYNGTNDNPYIQHTFNLSKPPHGKAATLNCNVTPSIKRVPLSGQQHKSRKLMTELLDINIF